MSSSILQITHPVNSLVIKMYLRTQICVDRNVVVFFFSKAVVYTVTFLEVAFLHKHKHAAAQEGIYKDIYSLLVTVSNFEI